MSYCWNPSCTNPQNLHNSQNPQSSRNPQNSPQDNCCPACGSSLQLRDRYTATRRMTQPELYYSWQAIDLDQAETSRVYVMRYDLGQTGAMIGARIHKAAWEQQVKALKVLGGRLGLPRLIEAWNDRDEAGAERGYIVRQWIEGSSLSQEQNERSPLDESDVRSLLADLLPIVQYIHSRRLIHGNLQPDTLIRDAADRLIPINFGAIQSVSSASPAKTAAPRSRSVSLSLPKLNDYSAPELFRGGAVPASDLYSLGAIAVQSLTTFSPLELYDPHDDQWHWRDFISPEQPVSPQFGRLLDRLLATSLDDRYASAIDVLTDLEALSPRSPGLNDRPIATTIPIPPAPKAWQRWLGLSTPPALSPTGLDCTDLRDALAARDWSKADRETVRLLCAATQTRGNYLHGRELDRLAADDLVMIDRLWREASDDRFGWSVQQRIYREAGGDYARFCARVGWPLAVERMTGGQPWQYRRSASEGHLPSRRWAGGQAMRSIQLLFDRVEQCQIALPPRRCQDAED